MVTTMLKLKNMCKSQTEYLWYGTMAALFCSALSQEEQDDAQLKIEDILQMVSHDLAIPNRL